MSKVKLVKAWAEPDQCPTASSLQRRVDREDQVQRAIYPACNGRSRIEADSALRIPRRRYTREWEKRHWDLQLVKELLSHYAVPRQVDGSGKIGLYGGKLYVGTRHKRTEVLLQFDPTRCEWVISSRQNHQLARLPAETISKRCIMNLNIRP